MGGKLLSSCSSGQDLLAVEKGIKAAIDAWQYRLSADRCALYADHMLQCGTLPRAIFLRKHASPSWTTRALALHMLWPNAPQGAHSLQGFLSWG